MFIDVYIPYALDGNLAECYNDIMAESLSEWVLIVEHDVFLACNPHWYEMCVVAVEKAPTNMGLITCVTSSRKIRDLRPQGATFRRPGCDDLNEHVKMAKRNYKKHGNEIEVHNTKYMAGFFMLVRKTAWRKVKFEDQGKGVHKVDHAFCKALMEAGYTIGVMKGLYVYHRRKVRELKWK